MDIKTMVKMVSVYRGVTAADVAKAMGETPANLSGKINRGNPKISTLEEIVNALGCHIVLSIVDNTTGETVISRSSKK